MNKLEIEEGERVYHPDENANELRIKLERIKKEQLGVIDGECFRISLPLSKFLLLEELSKEILIRRYEILDCQTAHYDEEITNFCLRMMQILDRVSPKGKYFGSHPEHTGVYGYWQIEGKKVDSKRKKVLQKQEGDTCVSS